LALPVGELDSEHLALPFPVDANGDEHRLTLNDAVLAHLLITSIENQVRIRFGQATMREFTKALIQGLVDRADGRRREAVAAQFFGDRSHLARGYTLHIHLHQSRNQCLLAALKAFEQRRRELAIAIARHTQLDLAHPRDQPAFVIAGPIAKPTRTTLARRGTQEIGHLRLQNLIKCFLDQRLQ